MSESKQRLERENRILRAEVDRLRGILVGLASGNSESLVAAQMVVRGARSLVPAGSGASLPRPHTGPAANPSQVKNAPTKGKTDSCGSETEG